MNGAVWEDGASGRKSANDGESAEDAGFAVRRRLSGRFRRVARRLKRLEIDRNERIILIRAKTRRPFRATSDANGRFGAFLPTLKFIWKIEESFR